jgi:hypothetical protein
MIEPVIEVRIPAALASLEQVRPAMRATVLAGGEHLKGKIAIYPAQRHGAAIWSQDAEKRKKQLRGFFYHLRQGDIEVPYRRGQSASSQSLGRKWTAALGETLPDGEQAVVGNNAPYASLVQGPEQTRYHQLTGWITTTQVAVTEVESTREQMTQAMNAELKRLGVVK